MGIRTVFGIRRLAKAVSVERPPSLVTQYEGACRDARKWMCDAIDARRAGNFDEARTCLSYAAMRVSDAMSALWIVERER